MVKVIIWRHTEARKSIFPKEKNFDFLCQKSKNLFFPDRPFRPKLPKPGRSGAPRRPAAPQLDLEFVRPCLARVLVSEDEHSDDKSESVCKFPMNAPASLCWLVWGLRVPTHAGRACITDDDSHCLSLQYTSKLCQDLLLLYTIASAVASCVTAIIAFTAFRAAANEYNEVRTITAAAETAPLEWRATAAALPKPLPKPLPELPPRGRLPAPAPARRSRRPRRTSHVTHTHTTSEPQHYDAAESHHHDITSRFPNARLSPTGDPLP